MTLNYETIVLRFLNGVESLDGKSHYVSRLFINDFKLYSYGYHFLMAQHYKNFLLVNSNGYSATTAKQKSILLNSTNKDIIFIDGGKVEKAQEQKDYNEREIKALLRKVKRQRTPYTKEATRHSIKNLIIQNQRIKTLRESLKNE